jgi:hypothetical protein
VTLITPIHNATIRKSINSFRVLILRSIADPLPFDVVAAIRSFVTK